jgi:hypothetical protein
VGWDGNLGRVNTEFTAFTIRGTSDWDDRSGGTPFNGEPHVWSLRKSAVRKAQWADGNLEFQVLDTGSVAPAPNHDLVIAARHENGSIVNHSNIEVAEIIIYDSALSDDDVSRVQGYLAHKWALTEPMPSGHPYKSSKPVFENRPELLLASPFTLLLDQNVSISLPTNRPADQILADGLPPGLELNATAQVVTGMPTTIGTYFSTFETSNPAGSLSKTIEFKIKDFSPWIYSSSISFPGYTESSMIKDFTVYVELNSSVPGFSYEQFASKYGHDLRFLTGDGKTELAYEPIEWNRNGTSSFWVLIDEMDANTSIRAIWGNPNYGEQPSYCRDGTVWDKYRAVWHMDGDDPTLVRDSRASYHATPHNIDELRVTGVIGKAVSFDGSNDYLELPLDSHPPAGTDHLTISFWTHGNFATLTNSTLFESGSALGRHLNVHFPWSNSRFYWDAGMSNQYDRIEKEDSNYLGCLDLLDSAKGCGTRHHANL